MTDAMDPPPGPEPRPTAGGIARATTVGRRVRAGSRRATPFVGGVVAAFLAIVVYGLLNPPAQPLTTRDVREAVASALASQTPGPPRGELVYDAIRPSIVLIETDAVDSNGSDSSGLGTGVVVNDAGVVLTALHVVADATKITVTYPDGSKSTAAITSQQPDADIAVLQPDSPPAGVIPATLGNPGSMRIGSDAYVVGNPFGLYGSLSSGVVSGLDRSYHVPDSTQVIHGLIQIDAAVNPGNSGGPLLDRSGRVVGIVTALVNPTKQDVFIGIGFAVPIDVAGGAAGLPAY